MPSKTKKQANFMAAVANNPKFAKKAGVPQSVGKDFAKADKGRTFKEGGMPGMRQDKRTMRNLDDEMYRIRNRTGSNTDAERRRINREKDFERNQMAGMNKGGKVKGYMKGGKTQGYNDRLDESMGARNGKKSQSMTSRRNESKGMEKSMGKGAYSGASTMMNMGGKVKGYKKGGKTSSCDGKAQQGLTRAPRQSGTRT